MSHRRRVQTFKPSSPARTNVTEFSRTDLGGGNQRTIAVLAREGDRPVLAIGVYHGGALLNRMLFHAPNMEPIERALAEARNSRLTGRRDGGTIFFGQMTIEVWARRTTQTGEPAVLLARSVDGARRGGLVTISGAELDALAAAVAHVRALSGSTP